jgi:hypothetical protein
MVEKMEGSVPGAAMMNAMFALLAWFSGQVVSPASCPATEMIRAAPPATNNAGTFGDDLFWVNADRSLWMRSATGAWHVGYNQKNMMWKPSGMRPTISGVRVDASAPPMEARWVPQLVAEFQTMGLTFPTVGCWKIRATAGDHTLEFVTNVEALPKQWKDR